MKTNNAKLTCYVQTPSEELPHLKKKGAVLVLPGGGFTMCSNREAEPVALAYLQAGYQAFVLDYSTGDRNNRESMAAVFPKALTDAVEAMEYLRVNAEALYLIPDKIAVVGFSAGGKPSYCTVNACRACSTTKCCHFRVSICYSRYPV